MGKDNLGEQEGTRITFDVRKWPKPLLLLVALIILAIIFWPKQCGACSEGDPHCHRDCICIGLKQNIHVFYSKCVDVKQLEDYPYRICYGIPLFPVREPAQISCCKTVCEAANIYLINYTGRYETLEAIRRDVDVKYLGDRKDCSRTTPLTQAESVCKLPKCINTDDFFVIFVNSTPGTGCYIEEHTDSR